MRAPGLMEGAGAALAAAVGGSALMFALAGVVAAPLALRAVVAAVGLGYLLYLLARAGGRTGRVSMLLAWAVATGVTLILDPPLLLHVAVQVALASLARAFRAHRSVLPALADLALSALAVAAAVWAAERTGSVFMAIWCLLLVQAAWVAIPRRGGRRIAGDPPGSPGEPFARAHRSAEAALRRLSAAR